MDVRFVYLPKPAQGLKRLRSQFQATYAKTVKELASELRHLNAKDVTIQAGYASVRNDGWPYSNSHPEHPGVILQFRRAGNVLTFKGYRYRSFEENLRAITLSLGALRTVDRYGVVEGEQYVGFKAIEAPAALTREDRIRNLRDNAATTGERDAAQAALDRMKGGVARLIMKVIDAVAERSTP